MKLFRTLFYPAALLLLVAGAQAQNLDLRRFSVDGLSFDSPAGWAIKDQSSVQMQYLTLTRPGYAMIIVRSPRALIDSAEKVAQAKRIFQDAFVDAWTKNFSDSGAKAERS